MAAKPSHIDRIQALVAKKSAEPAITVTFGGKVLSAPLEADDAPRPETPAAAAPDRPTADVQLPEPGAEPEPDRLAPAAPDTSRVSERVRRSLEIERRAQVVREKSKAEAKERAEHLAQAKRARETADARSARAEEIETALSKERASLERELLLLKSDPLAFARSHGVTGAAITAYVNSGSNPVDIRMQELEGRTAAALRGIQADYEKKLSKVVDRIESARVETAQSAFFDHVTGEADRFEALNTIYSPEELWTKANALAEKNEKLQLGWDGDRLVEELEASARKDSRWQRVQTRFERKKTQTQDPQVPAKDPKREVRQPAEERPAATRERAPRAAIEHPVSNPRERHRNRVERMMRTTRSLG